MSRTGKSEARMEGYNTEQIRDLFEIWAREDSYPPFREQEYALLFSTSLCLSKPGLRILDVGCGTGIVASHLKKMGHYVVGLDLSPHAIERARTLGRIDEGYVADFFRNGMAKESFDVVVAFSVLLYVFDPRPFFAEAHRLLCPGGELLIGDHHRRNPYTMLHFSRPNWVDRLIEGRDNISRRHAIDEAFVYEGSRALFDWGTPHYASLFTRHANWKINLAHSAARTIFGSIRRVSQAPWTGNFMVIAGKKL